MANRHQNWFLISLVGFYCLHIVAGRTFDEQTPPNLITTTTTTAATALPHTTQPPEPQLNSTCFYAEPDLCRAFNESEPCKECMPHPVYSNSLVCCNVTDLDEAITCVSRQNGVNASSWTNIHIRNATLDRLDFANRMWKRLSSLAITDGNITQILGEFPRFSALKCLNVSNNNITSIPTRALKDLTLQVLDLSHNNLTAIPNLSSQSNLALDVHGNNNMLCKSISEFIERPNVTFVEPDETRCITNQTYNWFDSVDLLPFRQLQRLKQLDSECPKIKGYGNCTCTPQMSFAQGTDGQKQLVFAAKVNCTDMGLISLPDELPLATIALNVSNNSITSLSTMVNNHAYDHLVRLIADDNKIESFLDLEGTDFIRNFDTLDLRRNALKTIPYYLLSHSIDRNPEGRILFLEGNPLYCDCNSAKNFRIWLLEHQTHIPDYENIYCENMPKRVIDLAENKLCQSPHDWTDYIYLLITAEVFLLVVIIAKVSYDYWVFKTAGYLPWPASQMPKLPCDWLCET